MARYEVGGGAKNPHTEQTEDGAEYAGTSGDAFFERYQKDREEMERKNEARRIAELDANIKRLEETIRTLESNSRQPSPVLSTLRAEKDALIRKKVEWTNGRQIQDAVMSPEEEKQDVIERYKKGEATDEELLQTTERKSGELKKPAIHGTYAYDELFHENIDGDLILTFPEDVVKHSGFNVGDELALSVVDGNLVIKKI